MASQQQQPPKPGRSCLGNGDGSYLTALRQLDDDGAADGDREASWRLDHWDHYPVKRTEEAAAAWKADSEDRPCRLLACHDMRGGKPFSTFPPSSEI